MTKCYVKEIVKEVTDMALVQVETGLIDQNKSNGHLKPECVICYNCTNNIKMRFKF